MTDRKNHFAATASISLIAVAFSLLMPLCANADGALMQETPQLDPQTTSPETPAEGTMLHGSVRKHETSLDDGGRGKTNDVPGPRLDNNANSQNYSARLQTEDATSGASEVHEQAIKKLAAGVELSSSEYRSLGAGCAGLEITRTFFKKVGIVTAIYRGSPADIAGIRVGDKVLSNDDDKAAKVDPTIPLWQVQCGQEGAPVDVTVLRHGDPVELTLVRINIEDIQDRKARVMWEQMIRNLGYPKEGTFTAHSLKALESQPPQ